MASGANSTIEGCIKPPAESVIKKKVTVKEVEKWDVVSLNCKIVPRSKPSGLFEKIEERRKIRHENALRKLAQDLHEINLKTENDILLSSLEVKSHMKMASDKLEEIIKSLDIPEVVSYDNSVFLKFQNQANNLKTQQEKFINELHQDLNKYEDQRAIENRKVYQAACEEIRKIGYLLPYEVQMFIEYEAIKINQLSLSNRRCYDDLKLTLTLITAQGFKDFIDKMFCCKDKWLQIKFPDENSKGNYGKKKAGLSVRDAYYRLELKNRALTIRVTPDHLYSICRYEVWLQNVVEVVSNIESNVKSIIDAYKKVLKATYSMFDGDLYEIKKEIDSIHLVDFEERAIKPLIIEADRQQFNERQSLEACWQEILFDIRPQMEDMMEFLCSVISLWDRHGERVCEAKKLILQALEKEEEDDKAVIEDLEVKINIALDNLRQEFVKNKLEKAQDAVIDLLNTLKAKYETNYLRKIATVEDFYKLMSLEKEILTSEIKELLHNSAPSSKIFYMHEDVNQNLSVKNTSYRVISLCGHIVKNIAFWRAGLWKALKAIIKTPENFALPYIEEWVEKKVQNLADVTSTQMELIEKRFGRIKVEYYDKRLAEIKSHELLFNNHSESVKRIYEQIKVDLKNLTNREAIILHQAEKVFDTIRTNAALENRPEVIQSSQIMLEQRKQDLVENVKSVYEGFRADIDAKINEMKYANLNLMKSIKLFYEGGDFNAEEGKMYATKLETLDKQIKDYKNIMKELSKDENEMTTKAAAIFTPTFSLLSFTMLALLYEETLFTKQVRERFCDFVVKTKDLVKNFLSEFESFKKYVNCFIRRVRNLEVPVEDADFWLPVFQAMYKNVSNFCYPLEYPQTEIIENEEMGERDEEEEENSVNNEATKSPIYVPLSKPVTQRTTDPEPYSLYKDYKKELFYYAAPPENNGTFMAIISNNIWNEMDAQQRIGSKFYAKIGKRKVLRDDMVPLSYDEFANGILSKLLLCNSECEQLWIKVSYDLLSAIGRLKRGANYFLERKLEEYRDSAFRSLNVYEQDFVNCLRSLRNETAKVFQDLENKLLPLHGSPQNEHLLNDLEEEVVQKTSLLGTQWDLAMKSFQDQLNCFRLDHVVKGIEIKKIERQFYKMKQILFTEDLGDTLANLYMEYSNKGGYLIKRSFQDRKSQQQEASLICDRMLSDCQLKFDDEKVAIDVYFAQMKESIETERTYYKGFSIPNEKPLRWQLNFNLLHPPANFEECALILTQAMDKCLRKLRDFGTSKTNVHEESLLKWLENWKFNVKKIKKLYTVRYTEPPEPPQPLQPPQSAKPAKSSRPNTKTKKSSASRK